MSFFEFPERAPEPEEWREIAPWHGPPSAVLPGVVAVELVLARSERVALYVEGVRAYPEGFDFTLRIAGKPSIRFEDDQLGGFMRGWRHGEDDPDFLRFGVQFADGGKATNVGSDRDPDDDPPRGPILSEQGGGGGGNDWEQTYWVWPLPPDGPLAFVCEWPAHDIALTRTEIDSAVIREAAERAESLWPDVPRGQGDEGGTWSALRMIVKRPNEPGEDATGD